MKKTSIMDNPSVGGWILNLLSWDGKMEEIDGEVDAIARRAFFEENELDSWDKTDELSSVIATVMDIDRRCQTNKIFWDTPIFVVDIPVRAESLSLAASW